MSKLESQGDSRELSLEDQRQVDRLCHEFKRELKADAGQRIEDYLDRLPESLRPFALGELLSLELDILSDRGVTLDASA